MPIQKLLNIIRFIACGILLLGFSQFVSAGNVQWARQDLINRDFDRMMDTLNTLLTNEPNNQDALFLRALARTVRILDGDIPSFLDSLGINLTVDLTTSDFEADFESDIVRFQPERAGRAWLMDANAGTAELPVPALPYLEIRNNNSSPRTIDLTIGHDESLFANTDAPYPYFYLTFLASLSNAMSTPRPYSVYSDYLAIQGESALDPWSTADVDWNDIIEWQWLNWIGNTRNGRATLTIPGNSHLTIIAEDTPAGLVLDFGSPLPSGMSISGPFADWSASGNRFSLVRSIAPEALLSFTNTSESAVALSLALDEIDVSPSPSSWPSTNLWLVVDNEYVGDLYIDSGNVYFWSPYSYYGYYGDGAMYPALVAFDHETRTLSLELDPGQTLTIETVGTFFYNDWPMETPTISNFWNNVPVGFSWQATEALRIATGIEAIIESQELPALAVGTTMQNFNAFLADVSAGALEAVLADLAAINQPFSIVLFPAETGLVENVVIAYADVQILRSIVDAVIVAQQLLSVYDFDFELDIESLNSFGMRLQQILAAHPDLLTVKSFDRAAALATRANARTRLINALNRYREVESELWQRQPPTSGDYLFAVDLDETANLEEERQWVIDWLDAFENGLFTQVTETDFPSGSGAGGYSQYTGFAYRLFEDSDTDLNPRALLRLFENDLQLEYSEWLYFSDYWSYKRYPSSTVEPRIARWLIESGLLSIDYLLTVDAPESWGISLEPHSANMRYPTGTLVQLSIADTTNFDFWRWERELPDWWWWWGYPMDDSERYETSSRNPLYVPMNADFSLQAVLIEPGLIPAEFYQWMETFFPAGTPMHVMEPMADASGDGVTNLLSYAMGLNPLHNNRRELPAFEKMNGDFHFIFRRNPNAHDLSYHVQASSDLRDWQEIYAPQVPILPDGAIDPHSEQVSMNLSDHLTNGFRFFRLRISRYGD